MNKPKPTQPSSPPTNPEQTVSFQADAPTPTPAAAPKQIGRFVVLRMLGEGAFGQVFKARDPQLDREVAIKVPKPGVFASDQERERFLREARAAAAIQHPNVCAVHEVNADSQALYIVMAYIAGNSLADYLRERKTPLTPKQAALIVRKLAQALHVAHQKGVVHRDLKPANILFDRERKDVVITDFGLARRERAGDADLTQAGAILGTPAYMSPEQARGDNKAIGPASDIFSLGVILYELLTGARPFKGSMGEVLGKVQHVTPESPSKLKPGVDARLDKICSKAMAKLPNDRFGSMREFAYHLGEFVKDAPTGAFAAGTPSPRAETAGPSEAAQMAEIIAALSIERQAETQKLERSHRSLAKTILGVGGCLGLLLVLSFCTAGGVGGWLYWRGDSDKPDDTKRVTVTLQNITHLHDNSVHYYLNGTKIDSKKLEGPLQLALGENKLEGKRGDKVVESRTFQVRADDNQKRIVAPITEIEHDVGPICEMKMKLAVRGLAVSPDGRWILASVYGTAINRRATGGILTTWEFEGEKKSDDHPVDGVEKIVLGCNGILYCGMHNHDSAPYVMEYTRNPLDQWEDLRRFQPAPGEAATPLTLDASCDGKRLLLGAPTRLVVWNFGNANTPEVTLDGFHLGCLSPDGQQLFAAKGNEVSLFEIRGGKAEPIRTFQGHTSPVTSIACSPDGRTLAAGTGGPANAVRTWEVTTGTMLGAFKNHNDGVTQVHFSPAGNRLMSVSNDYLRISDVNTRSEAYQTPTQPGITSAVFSTGGRRTIFGLTDGTIKVWQLPK